MLHEHTPTHTHTHTSKHIMLYLYAYSAFMQHLGTLLLPEQDREDIIVNFGVRRYALALSHVVSFVIAPELRGCDV